MFLLNPRLQSKVSEENRLAVVIHQIDEEASVVPRGAFIRDLQGLVQVNRSFAGKYIILGHTVALCVCVRERILFDIRSISHHSSGLSPSEATRLSNFLHFRKPKNKKKRCILEMADLNPAIDFLDVVSDDIPKGRSPMSGLNWNNLNLHQALGLPSNNRFLR